MANDRRERLAILYPGDYETRTKSTAENNRFADLFRAFAAKEYTPSLRFIATICAPKFVNSSCTLTVCLSGLTPFRTAATDLFSIPCFVRWRPQGFLSAHIPTSF